MPESVFPEGVALVVGGSGGVGQAIALKLAEQGCDVAVTYRSKEAAAQAVVEQIQALGRRASAHLFPAPSAATSRWRRAR